MYSSSRSKRASQSARCSAIQCSAAPSAAGSIRQVLTRPAFSERTIPLASSTFRCCTNDGSAMAKGSASVLTDAGPSASRRTTARRVGSARAWNMRSRASDC